MPNESSDPNSKHKTAWICFAVDFGWGAVNALLDAGLDINAVNLPERNPAITLAIDKADMEMVSGLLGRGADVNIGRPVIAAMKCDKKELRLPFVKLLVEHGLNVNKLYDLYGNADDAFTALDWAKDEQIAGYLRSHGAKHADELRARPAPTSTSPTREVIDYFRAKFGPVDERALIEIVPGGTPIAVNCIRPSGNREYFTLFTTGLSDRPMQTPAGNEEFALAELYLQLPRDWKIDALDNPTWNWPSRWLRKLGQYPYNHGTWLGGPLTVVSNDDPPQPLAPNTKMTCLLMFADDSLTRKDGKKVQLFRIIPVYTEERDLEFRDGAAALMRKLDRHSVPFIVDLKRPSTM